MTSHIHIAAATHQHMSPLCELFFNLFEHQFNGAPNLFRLPAREDTKESDRLVAFIKEILNDESQALLVASRSAETAGFVHVRINRAPTSPSVPFRKARCEGWIQHIAVAQEHRCFGIGRELVLAAKEWAQSQGTTAVGLQVWDFNKSAQTFFEKMGFQVRTLQLFSEQTAQPTEDQ